MGLYKDTNYILAKKSTLICRLNRTLHKENYKYLATIKDKVVKKSFDAKMLKKLTKI